jgi:hypothetical protein
MLEEMADDEEDDRRGQITGDGEFTLIEYDFVKIH